MNHNLILYEDLLNNTSQFEQELRAKYNKRRVPLTITPAPSSIIEYEVKIKLSFIEMTIEQLKKILS